MDLSNRLKLGLQNGVFLVLFTAAIGLVAWLSNRYPLSMDWSAGARNTLSEASQTVLTQFQGPLRITAFAREDSALRNAIRTLVGRYQRYKADITLSFVNPDAEPDRVRELNITRNGALYIEFQGRTEKVQLLTERGLTNGLQRLGRRGDRVVIFLTGHGERKPFGQANHDLGTFGQELRRTGIQIREHNLTEQPHLPTEINLLVIASPQVALLAGEVSLILDYLARGGNLLWFTEPGETAGLQNLADYLGIRVLPGVIVDADTRLFGIDNPAFALVSNYGNHLVTRDLQTLTLFPSAAGFTITQQDGWNAQPLLVTQPRTWTERDDLQGTIRFDPGTVERRGPLPIAVVLSKAIETQNSEQSSQQRVAVLGDGDFLSNTYLGNGGNLTLGLNMMNWLSQDDGLIAIRAKPAPDQTLDLSDKALLIIGSFFLVALPVILLSSGGFIWLWRRSR